MPPLVQVATPASKNAQILTSNSSSTPVSSEEKSRDRAFSRHMEAQQHDNKHQARRAEREDETTASSDSSVGPSAMAASGNELPPEDELLPQQADGSVAEFFSEESMVETISGESIEIVPVLPRVDGEILTATARPMTAEVRPEPDSQFQFSGLSARSNVTLSGVADELKLSLGSTGKVSLLGGSTPKRPAAILPTATQVVSDAFSNGPKDNFEQVRQNIMAALAGKPEIPSPANLAVSGGGHEPSEAATQGLNFSNVSATLAATGAESAKYTATQESAPPRFFTLQTPAGQPGWDVEVGNRIRWMVGQNNTGVELRLNPPELGSIEVKVATEGERTSITFFAANPAARDALELALPRLREMFADSGMQLANADVSDQGLQQEREQLSGSEKFSGDNDRGGAMILETEPGFTPGEQVTGRGVIDYYI